jgi:3-oxoacyl-[acyl-carrier protein] reductase
MAASDENKGAVDVTAGSTPGAGELAGRVCLVTGSTRGIGRAIAERFAAEGGQVIVHGRDAATAAAVAQEIGGDALGFGAELGDPAAATRLVADVLERTDRLDVLVNNAGVARDHFVTRLADEDWDASLRINASAPFHLIRAAVPALRQQSGSSILNVVSWVGLRGRPGQSAYAASKGALFALTLSCAKELGRFGIRVNAISPSALTDMNAAVPDEVKQEVARSVALGRWGTVEEVAHGALFLVSDRASYTTGQVLHVDGGMHLT